MSGPALPGRRTQVAGTTTQDRRATASIRATAQGLVYNSGRAVSALAPLVIGTLAKTRGIGPALGLTSAFFVLGAVLVLLLPETRGQALDDTTG